MKWVIPATPYPGSTRLPFYCVLPGRGQFISTKSTKIPPEGWINPVSPFYRGNAGLKNDLKNVRGPKHITSRLHMGHPEPGRFRKNALPEPVCHLTGSGCGIKNPENPFLTGSVLSPQLSRQLGH